MAEKKQITLYAAVDSPFPHRVRLALEEAKAKYDTIWIDLMEKQEWYEAKVYPGEGRVPYLIYGGSKLNPGDVPSDDALRVHESLLILQFLADLFPNLLPADPIQRAKARSFMDAVDKKLLPAWFPTVFMGAPTDGTFAVLGHIQSLLPPTGFALGEWSIADAAIIPILLRMEHVWRLNPFTLQPGVAEKALETYNSPRFTRLRQYIDDNKKRENVKKTWDEDNVAHHFGRRMDRFKKTGIVNKDLRLPVPPAAQ